MEHLIKVLSESNLPYRERVEILNNPVTKPGTYLAWTDENDTDTYCIPEAELISIVDEEDDGDKVRVIKWKIPGRNEEYSSQVNGSIWVIEIKP